MRSKTSLDSSGFLTQGFWSWFCKLLLFDTSNYWSNPILESLEHKPNKANIVRTTQFNTILNKLPVTILKIRASTCLPKSVPYANPHLETSTMTPHSLEMISNPVVPVCNNPQFYIIIVRSKMRNFKKIWVECK